jgi:hypothetical protein
VAILVLRGAQIFYGLAGIKHLLKGNRNHIETVAMISDVSIFMILAIYLGSGLIDYSQKMTTAAMQMADMKVWAHRS